MKSLALFTTMARTAVTHASATQREIAQAMILVRKISANLHGPEGHALAVLIQERVRDVRNKVAAIDLLRGRVLELCQQLDDLPDFGSPRPEPQPPRRPENLPTGGGVAMRRRKTSSPVARVWWNA